MVFHKKRVFLLYVVFFPLFLAMFTGKGMTASDSELNDISDENQALLAEYKNIKPSKLTHFSHSFIPKTFRIAEDLSISGSHQYTLQEFQKILSILSAFNKKVVVVDLREEPHWMRYYSKTLSVEGPKSDAFNGLSSEEIQQFESDFVKRFQGYQTEKSCVEKMGAAYIRIPVTDVSRPEDTDVDQFIRFIRSIKNQNYWLHFHCLAGKGRTTTFMSMYEMLKTHSSGKDRWKQILRHQHQLGGADLLNMWYSTSRIEWKKFLKDFCEYAETGFKNDLLWSEWISKRRPVFKETPSMTPFWSLKGLVSYTKYLLMMAGMKLYKTKTTCAELQTDDFDNILLLPLKKERLYG